MWETIRLHLRFLHKSDNFDQYLFWSQKNLTKYLNLRYNYCLLPLWEGKPWIFSRVLHINTLVYEKTLTWLDLWLRPNCWTALSALQGSSSVRCRRRFWLAARLSACSEIPLLAASEIIAKGLRPPMKWSFSIKFICSNSPLRNFCYN